MKSMAQITSTFARPIARVIPILAVGLALVAVPARGAIIDLFDLTDATGQAGGVVALNLLLTGSLSDFEGLDFFAPQYSSTALQLFGAPLVGLAASSPPDIGVGAPPTALNPVLGISNSRPGEAALSAGVLAVYRFTILGIAPGGSATVTLPFQIDEVDQPALTAEVKVAAIPEPASYALLGVGFVLLAWAGHRRATQT